MAVVRLRDQKILSETVDQNADHVISRFQRNSHILPAKHAKKTAAVSGEIKFSKFLFSFPLVSRKGNLQHFIHAVMLDLVVFGVVSDKIIVLIIPQKRPRTDTVPGAVFAQFRLFFDIPLIILEADAAFGADGFVEFVHVVVDALVHRFDAAGDDDLALQILGLVAADQRGQLPDQLGGLPVRDELGGLDGVDEEL